MCSTKTDIIVEILRKYLPHKTETLSKGVEGMMDYEYEPRNFESFEDHYLEAFLYDSFRKREDIRLEGIDPEVNAKNLFVERERINYVLNQRIVDLVQKDDWLMRIVSRARKYAAYILGEVPKSFAPVLTSGATTSLRTGNVPLERICDGSVTEKLLNSPYYDREACPWSRAGTVDIICKHDRLHFAVKTAKISRFLGLPVTRDIAYQRAYGVFMAERMKQVGIDLSTAQQVHQQMALRGSVTGEIATLDVENSSNSVYHRLVELIFPKEHYNVMMSLRSDTIDLGDAIHHYQMMGPNGNGFIFELQCVLYYALAAAATVEHTGSTELVPLVKINGDDIILADSCAETLIEVLRRLGIKINLAKSFYGPVRIRESCGIFAFNGTQVKGVPIYAIPQNGYEWTILCNRIYDRYVDHDNGLWRSRHIRAVWLGFVRRIKPSERCWAPYQYGPEFLHDGRYLSNTTSISNKTRRRHHYPCLKGWVVTYNASQYTRFSKLAHELKATSQQQLIAAVHPNHKGHGLTRHIEWESGEKREVLRCRWFPHHAAYWGEVSMLPLVGVGTEPTSLIKDFAPTGPKHQTMLPLVLRNNKWEYPYIWNTLQRIGYVSWWMNNPAVHQILNQMAYESTFVDDLGLIGDFL